MAKWNFLLSLTDCLSYFRFLLWFSNVHCNLCKGLNLVMSVGVLGTPFYSEDNKGKTHYSVFITW